MDGHVTIPRRVVPESTLFITRSCTQRQFLLRPDDETNNAFVYCLAEAAKRFDMQIVLAQMMSNHEHLNTYDANGTQVEFREHLHKMLAKCMNAVRGRWENFWSSEETCVVETYTAEDLMNKLVYTATNPVKDGLVERVHQWPGPKLVHALLTGTKLKAYRPRHFFRENGTMPAEIELELTLPDYIEDKPAFLAELARRIHLVEVECARTRQQTGRRVIGRRSILRQSWRDSPTTFAPHRGLRPRLAARNKWLRMAALQRNKEWVAAYRHARLQWLAGFDVEFPYGTYWLRRFARVVVQPPPPTLAN